MNAPIPMDPVEAETRIPPEDLATCDHCRGSGVVWDGWDPQSADTCPVCKGEGILPEYLGGAA